MEDNDHVLCVPRNREEWRAYNAIRRKVLLENRGEVGVYIENDPDQFARGHQLALIRVDINKRGSAEVDTLGRSLYQPCIKTLRVM